MNVNAELLDRLAAVPFPLLDPGSGERDAGGDRMRRRDLNSVGGVVEVAALRVACRG